VTKNFSLCLLVSWTFLIFTSCKQTGKVKPDRAVPENKDTCNCGNMEPQPPPPLANFIISTDSIIHKEDNKNRLFTVSLIADKTVVFEGKHMQIFHIKTRYHNKKESYDFALPTKYNKYWSELHMYKDIQNKRFTIGFENTDSNFIHLLYSVYLDTLSYDQVYVRLDFKEQKIKLKDKAN